VLGRPKNSNFMLTRLACNRVGRRASATRLCAGFNLLEVMVGVGVLAMLVFSIYRLVGTQLMALQVSRASQVEGAVHDGLVRYLQKVFQSIPPKQSNVMVGIPHLVGAAPADELQWLARSGPSLLTSAVTDDDYWLTLTVQSASAPARGQELGIRRRILSEPDNQYEWIPLIPDVAALEFRYFHPALAVWVDRWEDANARPSLVRMKLWRRASDQPYEVVFSVPSTKVQ